MKPIAMRCTQEQFDAIRPKLEQIEGFKIKDISNFEDNCYLVNNYDSYDGIVTNLPDCTKGRYNRIIYKTWDEQTFLEYCGYKFKDNKPITKQRLIVSVQDVLEIHKIACASWKTTIATYLSRANFYQEIKFTQNEIDKMFKAATPEQLPVLERIFGKKVDPIDWDRIKTGSKVMIKETDQYCGELVDIDFSKRVDVVFYKTPHLIDYQNCFKIGGYFKLYCTFHQNGKYILFRADKGIDYITEVIEY